MELEDLTPQQRAKLDGCENPEEILALARTEGVELSDAELEAVSGGGWFADAPQCPYCGAKSTRPAGGTGASTICGECGEAF